MFGLAMAPMIPDKDGLITESIFYWISIQHHINDITVFEHVQRSDGAYLKN